MRKRAFWLATVLVVILGVTAWTYRPFPPRTHTYVGDGYLCDITYSREWEWLPIREWGLSSDGSIGCGPRYVVKTNMIKLGFVVIIYSEEERYRAPELP